MDRNVMNGRTSHWPIQQPPPCTAGGYTVLPDFINAIILSFDHGIGAPERIYFGAVIGEILTVASRIFSIATGRVIA